MRRPGRGVASGIGRHAVLMRIRTNAQQKNLYPDIQDVERLTLLEHRREIADAIGRGCFLAELVSGDGENGEILFESLLAPAAYVIVDANRERLRHFSEGVARRHPQLDILPVPLPVTP